MIKFKISLLTPTILENGVSFIPNVLTNFLSQDEQHKQSQRYDKPAAEVFVTDHSNAYFEYTYNEKFSEEENSQKKLTFSMNKTIVTANTIYDNPFINFVNIGSLILFEDKYDNSHLFYVTDIQYEFKEFNTVYQVTCQDAFSYTTAKQRDGYTIDNDATSENFLGTFDIDTWTRKIVSDCYIDYEYLPLNTGICLLDTGELVSFTNIQELPASASVKKVLKEPYSIENEPELFMTFPFSGSGTAGSILIALGGEVGMHLKTLEMITPARLNLAAPNNENTSILDDLQSTEDAENDIHLDLTVNGDISLKKYFWFELTKNTKRLDSVYYSPRDSIQNFSLSRSGASLTTVLNVEGQTIGDETISLFPPITPFFSSLFSSKIWPQLSYNEGMFSSLMHGYALEGVQVNSLPSTRFDNKLVNYFYYTLTFHTSSGEGDENYIKIDLHFPSLAYNLFPLYQQLIAFYDSFGSERRPSSFIAEITGAESQLITPYNTNWFLKLTTKNYSEVKIQLGVDDLPSDLGEIISHGNVDATIEIPFVSNVNSFSTPYIYLTFKHIPSEEDIEFAEIADACPWLENKIIDFKYFLNKQIITNDEYTQLMNIFQNDLRIINGQLLVYSYQYYTALHKKTQELADLTASLDALGASIEHTFVDNYAKKGVNVNTQQFEENYATVFASGSTDNTIKTNILDYNNTTADYLNKFFDSQQRFFKYIKKFSDYFNSPISAPKLYQYNITFENYDSNKYLYFCNNLNDQPITSTLLPTLYETNESSLNYGKPYYDIYLIDSTNSNIKTKQRLADTSMLSELYIQNPAGAYTQLTAQDKYSSDYHYFKKIDSDYNLLTEPEIAEDYFNRVLSGTYKYREPISLGQITSAKVTLGGTTYYINNIIERFSSWFKPIALSYVYRSTTRDGQQIYNTSTWNQDSYKVFNAFLPISNYTKINSDNSNINCISVTPSNESDFYRPVAPIKTAGRIIGHILSFGLNTIWSWIADSINGAGFAQTLDYEGTSTYNLQRKYIKEYKNIDTEATESITIDNSSDIVTEQWCDSQVPFYSLSGENSFIGTNGSYDLKTLGVTPQLAAKEEMYYSYNRVKMITSGNIYRGATYVFVPIYDGWFISSSGDGNTKEAFLNALKHTVISIPYVQDVEIYPLLANAVQLPVELWTTPDTQHTTSDGTLYQTTNKMSIAQLIANSDGMLSGPDSQGLFTLNDDKKVALCQIFNYDLINITKETDTLNNHPFDYNKHAYTNADEPVVWLEQPGVLTGLYKNNDSFIPADSFALDGQYYIYNKDKDNYTRIHTIQTFYTTYTTRAKYNDPTRYSLVQSDDKIYNFTIPLIQQDRQTHTKRNISVIVKFSTTSPNQTVAISGDIVDNLVFTRSYSPHEIMSQIKTNGDFWYNYHSSTTNAVLQTRAAGIEAQLTEYWMQAYSASKYCDSFLPETWTLGINGVNNRFAELLYDIRSIKDSNDTVVAYTVKILNNIIPEVKIYQIGNQTQFPRYRYIKNNEYPTADTIASRPIQDMFTLLDENTKDWNIIENGTQVYYYNANDNSGMSWVKFLELFNKKYPKVSGLYKMAFHVLKDRYNNSPQTQYQYFKEQQDALWRRLYQSYYFLMFENTYKNDTATTSKDLLQLSQLAFRDYAKPEANYNISVIDIASLSGYDGSEIHIGDGIRIKSTEYYDLYDDMSKDLSQFLFITSINYELRKATDISLNVNAIKYQDKLIKQLIKYVK